MKLAKYIIAISFVAAFALNGLSAYNLFGGKIIRPVAPSDSTIVYETDAAKKMDKAADALDKATKEGTVSKADSKAIMQGAEAYKSAKGTPLVGGIGFGVIGNGDGDVGANMILSLDKGSWGLVGSVGYIPITKDMDWSTGNISYSVGLVYRFNL